VFKKIGCESQQKKSGVILGTHGGKYFPQGKREPFEETPSKRRLRKGRDREGGQMCTGEKVQKLLEMGTGRTEEFPKVKSGGIPKGGPYIRSGLPEE